MDPQDKTQVEKATQQSLAYPGKLSYRPAFRLHSKVYSRSGIAVALTSLYDECTCTRVFEITLAATITTRSAADALQLR